MQPEDNELTALLQQWSAGDKGALDQVMGKVHSELRRLAAFHLRDERRDGWRATGALPDSGCGANSTA